VTKRAGIRPLEARSFTYSPVGATAVASQAWPATPAAFRRYEQTGPVRVPWDDARSLMLRWAVKTRSGFEVDQPSVGEGVDAWLRFGIGPVAIREPVRVVAVVDDEFRCGFSYGTLEGHPVSGEEAFVVHRAAAGEPVLVTIRSLTRPANRGWWRCAYPALLVAQRGFRQRYLRALNQSPPRSADPG
jgi:uncharacterized protein (UPF0548 family)